MISHPIENALLDHLKQFDPDGLADFADLVQKDGTKGAAPVEDAFVIFHRTGEGKCYHLIFK